MPIFFGSITSSVFWISISRFLVNAVNAYVFRRNSGILIPILFWEKNLQHGSLRWSWRDLPLTTITVLLYQLNAGYRLVYLKSSWLQVFIFSSESQRCTTEEPLGDDWASFFWFHQRIFCWVRIWRSFFKLSSSCKHWKSICCCCCCWWSRCIWWRWSRNLCRWPGLSLCFGWRRCYQWFDIFGNQCWLSDALQNSLPYTKWSIQSDYTWWTWLDYHVSFLRFFFNLHFIFSHEVWFQQHDPLIFPLGKLTRHLRQAPKVDYILTSDGVQVVEALTSNHEVISLPAEVEVMKEYRWVFWY